MRGGIPEAQTRTPKLPRLTTIDTAAALSVVVFWGGLFAAPRLLGLLQAQGDTDSAAGKLQIQDILFPFFLAYIYVNRRTVRTILGPTLIRISIIWGVFCLVQAGLSSPLRHYPPLAAAAFAGKELQYLVSMAFFAAFAARRLRFTVVSCAVVLLPVFGFATYQVIIGNLTGYYGVGLPFEAGVAAPSEVGAVASIMFVCGLSCVLNIGILFGRAKRIRLIGALASLALCALAAVVLLGSISRSNIIGAVVASFVVILVRVCRGELSFSYFLPVAIAISLAGIMDQNPVLSRLTGRFAVITSNSLPTRAENWRALMEYQLRDHADDFVGTLFGFGLGSPNFLLGNQSKGFTLGVDSQYVRRLFEVGLVGSLLWFLLLAAAAYRVLRQGDRSPYGKLTRDVCIGLFVLLSVVCIGLEALQVVRIATLSYAIIGSLLGARAVGQARGWRRVIVSESLPRTEQTLRVEPLFRGHNQRRVPR